MDAEAEEDALSEPEAVALFDSSIDLVGVASELWVREAVLERLGIVDFVGVAAAVEVLDTDVDPDPVRLPVFVWVAWGDRVLVREEVVVSVTLGLWDGVELWVVDALADADVDHESDADAEEDTESERLPVVEELLVTDQDFVSADVAVGVQVITRVAVEV